MLRQITRARGLSELLEQLVAMRPLHHEDDVGPFDEFIVERSLGVVVGSRRCHFDVSPSAEHLLGRRASQAILTADEKNVPDHARYG